MFMTMELLKASFVLLHTRFDYLNFPYMAEQVIAPVFYLFFIIISAFSIFRVANLSVSDYVIYLV